MRSPKPVTGLRKAETNDSETETSQKIDNIVTKLESSQKEMVHGRKEWLVGAAYDREKMARDYEKWLAKVSHNRQKMFDNLNALSLFSLSLTLQMMYRFLTRSKS